MNECFWDSFELDPEDVGSFTKHLEEKSICYHTCLFHNRYLVEVKSESEQQSKELQQWIEDTYYVPLF